MKKLMITMFAAAALCGCTTTTPYPKSTTLVAVGMTYKCDKAELGKKGADLDVNSMYEMVHATYGDIGAKGHSREYIVMRDSNAKVQAVKTALKTAVESELAIIYFSCKATQVEAKNDPTEADGLDEGLMLYDGVLLDNDIWEILNTAKGRVFIVFDTSYSASMFRASKANMSNELKAEFVDANVNPELKMVCWAACPENATIEERSIGSRLTNAFYFKEMHWISYDEVFKRMMKSTAGKQDIKKVVVGEDFSSNTIFR